MKKDQVPTENRSDEDLMLAYMRGDADAFDLIYERHAGRVYAMIRYYVKGEQEQNDILQEIFLRLHRSRHFYESSREFLPWLFSISRNIIFDHLRKSVRKLEDPYEPGQAVFDNVVVHPASLTPHRDQGTIEPDLSSLSERQKKVLSLRYKQDLSFDEIGRHLNIDSSAVRQIASRAIRKLRTVLGAGNG